VKPPSDTVHALTLDNDTEHPNILKKGIPMNARTTLIALTLASLAASSASAAVTGVSGSATLLGSPPLSCAPGGLPSFTLSVWDEQTNIPLTSYSVNMVNNPGSNLLPIPGTLTGNYDSHFLSFDGLPGIIGVSGTVTFSAPIDAVIFRALDLSSSDPIMGSPGTTYPTGYPFRDISVNPSNGFSISGNVLTFNFLNFSSAQVPFVAQLRVLTQVPAPGSVAFAGLAGLATLRRRRRA
jgi:uncharacterized protein (TIGR03382 family)